MGDHAAAIDLIAAYGTDAGAPGVVVPNLPAGLPKFTNVPGKEPTIQSTAGVKVPTTPTSTLVVSGTGDLIDSSKTAWSGCIGRTKFPADFIPAWGRKQFRWVRRPHLNPATGSRR